MKINFFCEYCQQIREGIWWVDVEEQDLIELMRCPICGKERRLSRTEIKKPVQPTKKEWEIKDKRDGRKDSNPGRNKEVDEGSGSPI